MLMIVISCLTFVYVGAVIIIYRKSKKCRPYGERFPIRKFPTFR